MAIHQKASPGSSSWPSGSDLVLCRTAGFPVSSSQSMEGGHSLLPWYIAVASSFCVIHINPVPFLLRILRQNTDRVSDDIFAEQIIGITVGDFAVGQPSGNPPFSQELHQPFLFLPKEAPRLLIVDIREGHQQIGEGNPFLGRRLPGPEGKEPLPQRPQQLIYSCLIHRPDGCQEAQHAYPCGDALPLRTEIPETGLPKLYHIEYDNCTSYFPGIL